MTKGIPLFRYTKAQHRGKSLSLAKEFKIADLNVKLGKRRAITRAADKEWASSTTDIKRFKNRERLDKSIEDEVIVRQAISIRRVLNKKKTKK